MKSFLKFIKERRSNDGDAIVITFGRFNPPTIGHEVLIDRVKKEANARNADHKIFASQSQDAKKNPLPFKDKVKFMQKMFPRANISTDTSFRHLFELMPKIAEEYDEVYLVVGADRVQEFEKSLSKYWVDEDDPNFDPRKHFSLDHFEVISAGERDPDADDVTGMSASKMREFAKQDDFESFKQGLPKTLDERDSEELFNKIKDNLKG